MKTDGPRKKGPMPPHVRPGKPGLPLVCAIWRQLYENVWLSNFNSDPASVDRSDWAIVHVELWKRKNWSQVEIAEALEHYNFFNLNTEDDPTRLKRIHDSDRGYYDDPCAYIKACARNAGESTEACRDCTIAASRPKRVQVVDRPTVPTWLTHKPLTVLREEQKDILEQVIADYVQSRRGRLVINRMPTGTGKTTLTARLCAEHKLSVVALGRVTDAKHKPVAQDLVKTLKKETDKCNVSPYFLLRGKGKDNCQKLREEGEGIRPGLRCRKCECGKTCQQPKDIRRAIEDEDRVYTFHSWVLHKELCTSKDVIVIEESPLHLFMRPSPKKGEARGKDAAHKEHELWSVSHMLKGLDLCESMEALDRLIVINDATAPTWFYKALFPNLEVVEIAGSAEPMVHITQIVGYPVKIRQLEKPKNRDAVYQSVLKRMQQLGGCRVVLLGFKDVVADFKERLKKDLPDLNVDASKALGVYEVGTAHYFGLVGTNEYKDYDAAFIIGDPCRNWKRVVLGDLPKIVKLVTGRAPSTEHATERRYFERRAFLPMTTSRPGEVKHALPEGQIERSLFSKTIEVDVLHFEDEELQELFESQREGEIVQALGRLRPFEADPKKGIRHVFIYGNKPTEIPVDQVMTKDEDKSELGFTQAKKKTRTERQQVTVREIAHKLMEKKGEVDIMEVARLVPSLGLPERYKAREYGWRKLRAWLERIAAEKEEDDAERSWVRVGSGPPVWKETQTRLFDVG